MKTTSENNFEQQWKRKFENASVPPPSDMWDRIEADLDEQKKRTPFFLLWGVPAFVTSGIAATLILALGGWFLLNNTEENTSAKVVKALESSSEEIILEKSDVQSSEESVAEPFKTEPQETVVSKKVIASTASVSTNKRTLSELPKLRSNTTGFAQLMNEIILEEPKAGKITSQINPTFLENIADNLKEIVPHQFTELPVRYILKRNKLAYNEPIVEEETKEKRRSWIGLISGISPFKPNFQNGGLNQLASANAGAFSANDANFTIQRAPQGIPGPQGSDNNPSLENGFAIPAGSPVQQFNNGRAFNFGIQAGKQLTERLAFESGVRYIQGNSPVNSNVYTFNQNTGEINPFVQDYLTQDKTLSNAVVASVETLKNSYEYLSVPLQLAYEIPLRKKLNLEITGGLSADMFLQNTLQSETTDIASLNASNSVFRTLGVSGLGGVRLNYLFDEKWELVIGSAFQQALVSNFEAGSSAQLRPQMIGVNYGVNYHF